MRPVFVCAIFFTISGLADAAVPDAAPGPPQMQPPELVCADARNSADYVPGVDVHGRSVAPADLPGSTTSVQISTQVYAELRSTNPQLRGVGVVANLPGLQARNPCPPSPPPASAAKH